MMGRGKRVGGEEGRKKWILLTFDPGSTGV